MRIPDITQGLSPVLAAVLAVLFVILGIIIIFYPGLVAWIIGIGFILLGVALLAATFTGAR